MNTLDEIHRLAQQHGLVVRGGFAVDAADNVPCIDQGIAAVTLVLFGNVGSSLWGCFSNSREYADGLTDPLNRWSERIGAQIARQLSGRALFPFGGPPYQPFIDWAKKADDCMDTVGATPRMGEVESSLEQRPRATQDAKAKSLRHSKIGMLIHPQYGLWHAYRFAIALPEVISGLHSDRIADQSVEYDICQHCVDQPCLSACPVGAFTASGYDVAVCYDFLKQDLDTESGVCRKGSCQARMACPEGHEFRYQTEHARFHMDAFFNGLSNRLEN